MSRPKEANRSEESAKQDEVSEAKDEQDLTSTLSELPSLTQDAALGLVLAILKSYDSYHQSGETLTEVLLDLSHSHNLLTLVLEDIHGLLRDAVVAARQDTHSSPSTVQTHIAERLAHRVGSRLGLLTFVVSKSTLSLDKTQCLGLFDASLGCAAQLKGQQPAAVSVLTKAVNLVAEWLTKAISVATSDAAFLDAGVGHHLFRSRMIEPSPSLFFSLPAFTTFFAFFSDVNIQQQKLALKKQPSALIANPSEVSQHLESLALPTELEGYDALWTAVLSSPDGKVATVSGAILSAIHNSLSAGIRNKVSRS